MTRVSTQWFERSGTLMSRDWDEQRTLARGRVEYRPRLGVWDAERPEEGKRVKMGWREFWPDIPTQRCATLLDAAAFVLSPHPRTYDPLWKSGGSVQAVVVK